MPQLARTGLRGGNSPPQWGDVIVASRGDVIVVQQTTIERSALPQGEASAVGIGSVVGAGSAASGGAGGSAGAVASGGAAIAADSALASAEAATAERIMRRAALSTPPMVRRMR